MPPALKWVLDLMGEYVIGGWKRFQALPPLSQRIGVGIGALFLALLLVAAGLGVGFMLTSLAFMALMVGYLKPKVLLGIIRAKSPVWVVAIIRIASMLVLMFLAWDLSPMWWQVVIVTGAAIAATIWLRVKGRKGLAKTAFIVVIALLNIVYTPILLTLRPIEFEVRSSNFSPETGTYVVSTDLGAQGPGRPGEVFVLERMPEVAIVDIDGRQGAIADAAHKGLRLRGWVCGFALPARKIYRILLTEEPIVDP